MSADLIRAEALVREWHPDAELRVRRVCPRGWVATYGWPYEGGALASPGRYAPAYRRGYMLSAYGATRREALDALATIVLCASLCPEWPPGPDELALAAGRAARREERP